MNIYNQSYGLRITQNERNNKVGWHKLHSNHDILAKRLLPSVMLIGDPIVAGLSRYQTVWKKYYFKTYKALNCGILGDRTQHVLWRTEDLLSVPPSVKYVVVHCGSNKLDDNKRSCFIVTTTISIIAITIIFISISNIIIITITISIVSITIIIITINTTNVISNAIIVTAITMVASCIITATNFGRFISKNRITNTSNTNSTITNNITTPTSLSSQQSIMLPPSPQLASSPPLIWTPQPSSKPSLLLISPLSPFTSSHHNQLCSQHHHYQYLHYLHHYYRNAPNYHHYLHNHYH